MNSIARWRETSLRTTRVAPAWLASLVLAALCLTGCDGGTSNEDVRGPATQANDTAGLFNSVAESLEHLEQYETEQIHKQLCDRLNQWVLQDKPKFDWTVDPLIGQLGEADRKQPELRLLESSQFHAPDDAWYLQEAIWLRNISKHARADQFQDVAVAERLFDWTIRNIQLTPDAPGKDNKVNRHRPYQTLISGRGTAEERAWVFILLARQQGLDAVFLGIADQATKAIRPWLPALVVGDELYLFDTRLGLPVPGQSPGSVATLAQVAADEQLLRKLDLDAEHTYPITAEDLKHVVALVEGSPSSLSYRMALVESRLAGKHKTALTSPGSKLADRVKKLPHVQDARLWTLPYDVARRQAQATPEEARAALRETVMFTAMPALGRGRALHFQGEYEGEKGAKTSYLNARPPEDYIQNYKLPPEIAQRISKENLSKAEAAQESLMREGKQGATYWLGLIFCEQKDDPNAIVFLDKLTLQAYPDGIWRTGAQYNLARIYERQGDLDKAVALYELDENNPQHHGNRLRAAQLRGANKPESAPADAKPAAPEAAEPTAPTDPPQPPAEASAEPAANSPPPQP